MPAHSHLRHEIGLVHKGTCHIVLAQERRPLQAGDVFFIPGGVSHEFLSSQGYVTLIVTCRELAADLLHDLTTAPPIGQFHLSGVQIVQFGEICHQLQRELAGALPYAHEQCRYLVGQLAILLLRSRLHGSLPALNTGQQRAMETALQWIHEHVQEKVVIGELAARVGLSPARFRQLFHQYVGVSPKRYLLSLRLHASKSLLAQPDRTVGEAGELAGLGTPQQFSRVFRQHTGLTPTEWRRMTLSTP